jgi:hypothetical protein
MAHLPVLEHLVDNAVASGIKPVWIHHARRPGGRRLHRR